MKENAGSTSQICPPARRRVSVAFKWDALWKEAPYYGIKPGFTEANPGGIGPHCINKACWLTSIHRHLQVPHPKSCQPKYLGVKTLNQRLVVWGAGVIWWKLGDWDVAVRMAMTHVCDAVTRPSRKRFPLLSVTPWKGIFELFFSRWRPRGNTRSLLWTHVCDAAKEDLIAQRRDTLCNVSKAGNQNRFRGLS